MDKLKNNFTGYLFVIQLPSPHSPKKSYMPIRTKKKPTISLDYIFMKYC